MGFHEVVLMARFQLGWVGIWSAMATEFGGCRASGSGDVAGCGE